MKWFRRVRGRARRQPRLLVAGRQYQRLATIALLDDERRVLVEQHVGGLFDVGPGDAINFTIAIDLEPAGERVREPVA